MTEQVGSVPLFRFLLLTRHSASRPTTWAGAGSESTSRSRPLNWSICTCRRPWATCSATSPLTTLFRNTAAAPTTSKTFSCYAGTATASRATGRRNTWWRGCGSWGLRRDADQCLTSSNFRHDGGDDVGPYERAPEMGQDIEDVPDIDWVRKERTTITYGGLGRLTHEIARLSAAFI